MPVIGGSDLKVFPLCLGGTVFGWTADEPTSWRVLDAYAAAGGDFIDTADMYSSWAPGNSGGESETIIGRWMAARRNRDELVIATKVGKMPGRQGTSARTVRLAAEESLRRLGTDRIDLYYVHRDDTDTPLAETLEALNSLVVAGKVRYVAASNMSAARLAESLDVCARENFAPYVAVQEQYNLVARQPYEAEMRDLLRDRGLANVAYSALAKGLLTGKYRPGTAVDSVRAAEVGRLLDEPTLGLLRELDDIAAARGTTVAAVALAWLAAQPTVAVPIASARTVEQLADQLRMAELVLDDRELAVLDAASTAVMGARDGR
jgi:aryl-alcohol dehydrogenase-like predicted oxidoreductase